MICPIAVKLTVQLLAIFEHNTKTEKADVCAQIERLNCTAIFSILGSLVPQVFKKVGQLTTCLC